jgi:hypothetical protein
VAELDVVLAEVNRLATTVPADLQPPFALIRNALVKEAVDFSEVAHQVASPASDQPEAAPARPSARAATTKVLSVHAGPREELPEDSRRRAGPVVLLVSILLLAAAIHGYQFLARPAVLPPKTFDGAPANTMAIENGTTSILKALPGTRVDPAELARFVAQEERKGRAVREIGSGRWIIEPAPTGKGSTP